MLILAALGVTGALAATPGLQSIGVLDPANAASAVNALSGDGAYAVGWSNAANAGGTAVIQQPVIWSSTTGLVQLPNPGDVPGQATGVVVRPGHSAIGVSGQITNVLQTYAAPMGSIGSGTWLGTSAQYIAGPFNTSRLQTDISPAEERWWSVGQRLTGTRRGAAQRRDPDVAGDYRNAGNVMANSPSSLGGAAVAGWDSGNPSGAHRAILLSAINGTSQTVVPGGSGVLSEALGISVDGQVLSGFDATDATNNQAFIWKRSEAAMTLLGTLAGDTQSTAIAVNNAAVAAGFSSDGTSERAVIWDSSGLWDSSGQPMLLQNLLAAAGVDTSLWSKLTRATTISDNGLTVAGWGVWAADGSTRGFIASVPEPSTVALLLLGCFGFRKKGMRLV